MYVGVGVCTYVHVCVCISVPLGPLLYHYSDMPGELSIELSWEDVLRVARDKIGFEILVSPPENRYHTKLIFLTLFQTEKRNVPSHYIQNPCSMIQMTYKCVYLVARKPEKTPPTQQDRLQAATPINDTEDINRCNPWPL